MDVTKSNNSTDLSLQINVNFSAVQQSIDHSRIFSPNQRFNQRSESTLHFYQQNLIEKKKHIQICGRRIEDGCAAIIPTDHSLHINVNFFAVQQSIDQWQTSIL